MADSEAMRRLGDQLFSRTAGAPLMRGNAVRLLRDAAENYPAWLAAIRDARRAVHFENYIVHDDAAGERFATAFLEKAREGVRPRRLMTERAELLEAVADIPYGGPGVSDRIRPP